MRAGDIMGPMEFMFLPLALRRSYQDTWGLWVLAIMRSLPARINNSILQQRATVAGIMYAVEAVLAAAIRQKLLPLQELCFMLDSARQAVADPGTVNTAAFLSKSAEGVMDAFWAHGQQGGLLQAAALCSPAHRT